MEPPLKSRFRRLAHLLRQALCAPHIVSSCAWFRLSPEPPRKSPQAKPRARARPAVRTCLRAVRQILLCAQRRSSTGYAMFLRGPSPGPVWADASPAPERSAPFGVCHSALLLSALPVTGAGRAFLPRQGLGVFRHSRVSEKRSQTLNSLGGKT